MFLKIGSIFMNSLTCSWAHHKTWNPHTWFFNNLSLWFSLVIPVICNHCFASSISIPVYHCYFTHFGKQSRICHDLSMTCGSEKRIKTSHFYYLGYNYLYVHFITLQCGTNFNTSCGQFWDKFYSFSLVQNRRELVQFWSTEIKWNWV